MNKTIKASILLFGVLVMSRLLPLPANSEPLLGLAVLTPYLTKNNLAFLLPLGVMFVSDLFLGFHKSMLMTYSALALTPWMQIPSSELVSYTLIESSQICQKTDASLM